MDETRFRRAQAVASGCLTLEATKHSSGSPSSEPRRKSRATYTVLADEWHFYFDQLSGWTWILGGDSRVITPPQSYMKPVTSEAITNFEFSFEPLAKTRY